MTEQHENLLAAYFAGQLSDSEKTEFLSLLDSDAQFAARFHEMEQAYVAAFMPAFEKTREEDYRRLSRRMRGGTVRIWRPLAIAASLAAVLFLGSTLYTGNKLQDVKNFLSQNNVTTITATHGTGTRTLLPDGTSVCLNAGSTLSFANNFGRKGRNVKLDGEGFFEVAKNARKPFKVQAGNATVTVKGTVFNVRSYAEEPEISVSLLEGSVLLSSAVAEATLTPGTCGVVSRKDGRISLEAADKNVADWTRGKIVFTDKSIPEILASLQRHYGVHFVYDESQFLDERFTGIISAGLSIDEILSYIDVDNEFVWHRQDDTIEIHKK